MIVLFLAWAIPVGLTILGHALFRSDVGMKFSDEACSHQAMGFSPSDT